MDAHGTVFHDMSHDLDWLLEDFLKRVPHTTCAVLASSEGLRRALHGIEVDHAERLCATLSGMHSLARAINQHQGTTGAVRQIVVERDDLCLFVMGAGSGSLLGVTAKPDADLGNVGYEMAQLVKSVEEHLATPHRHDRPSSDTQ